MKRETIIFIIAALFLIAAATFPLYTGAYPHAVAMSVLMYLSLALSWDMLLRTGQISFGMAGFMGIGAYTAAMVSINLQGVPQIVTLLFGGGMAFVVALGIGWVVLRLRGMYFAIVTLALGEIFRIIIRNWTSFTGGAQGEVVPQVIFGGDSRYLYWLMLGVALVTLLVSEIFRRTKIHLAETAIRNNEMVASSSGINIHKYLVIIFAFTSSLQGLTGAAYAQAYGFVTPEGSFSTDFILLPLAMALLGGIYGSVGPMIGAVLLGVSGEYLKLLLPYGHQIVYGVIVVLVILFMPKGINGLIKGRLLHRGGRR